MRSLHGISDNFGGKLQLMLDYSQQANIIVFIRRKQNCVNTKIQALKLE